MPVKLREVVKSDIKSGSRYRHGYASILYRPTQHYRPAKIIITRRFDADNKICIYRSSVDNDNDDRVARLGDKSPVGLLLADVAL